MQNSSISNDSDKRNGIITSAVVTVAIIVLMNLLHYTMADPPPKDIPLIATTEITELEMEKLVIESGGGSKGSEGTPSDEPVDPNPKPQTERVITKKDSKTEIKTGKSNKTNGDNLENTPTSIVASPNPFGSGGGGNQGDGAGVFGKDDGPYRGGGKGTGGSGDGENGGDRIRLNNIITDGLEFNQTCTIVLKLTINADGKVIRTEVIAGRTTTTDQRIINQIAELVKQQIRYNKKPNSSLEKIALSLNIKAT